MSATAVALRKQNPLLLLSALSMLVGCYLLSGAASHQGGGLVLHTLPILGWQTLYELLLVGLALHLTRRGALGDGRTLIVIETLFLVDATHLTAEAVAATGSAWIAWILGFVAPAIKLALLAYGLRLRFRARDAIFVVATLGLILVLPRGFSALRSRGAVLDLALYASSWLVGLMLVVEALARRTPTPAADNDQGVDAAQSLGSALRVALPFSLTAHVLATHWLYGADVRACSVTPLLLALGVFVIQAPCAERAQQLRLILPLLAVALSADAAFVMRLDLGFVFSPLRAALLVAGVLYLYDYARHRQAFAAVLGAVVLVTAVGGHTVEAAYDRWVGFAEALADGGGALWGRLSIAMAFALLAAGSRRSLRRLHPWRP